MSRRSGNERHRHHETTAQARTMLTFGTMRSARAWRWVLETMCGVHHWTCHTEPRRRILRGRPCPSGRGPGCRGRDQDLQRARRGFQVVCAHARRALGDVRRHRVGTLLSGLCHARASLLASFVFSVTGCAPPDGFTATRKIKGAEWDA